jgi:hypothetical protein
VRRTGSATKCLNLFRGLVGNRFRTRLEIDEELLLILVQQLDLPDWKAGTSLGRCSRSFLKSIKNKLTTSTILRRLTMSRAERIAKQLGMSHGAANNKLRKSILFDLVQKLNLDKCFKCEGKIEDVLEFSVEHKLPWENRDSQLFWDLGNIAFSHTACNRPHTRNNGKTFKPPPQGKAWCSGKEHREFIDIKEFSSNKANTYGVEFYCAKCRAKLKSRSRRA